MEENKGSYTGNPVSGFIFGIVKIVLGYVAMEVIFSVIAAIILMTLGYFIPSIEFTNKNFNISYLLASFGILLMGLNCAALYLYFRSKK
ncbi:hypothetical protein RYZ26_00230 [Terasakiella sp. A23]|uniref:hypothetical protein n=1 Tax=Terasakiella sp. FCG-A23 TaxID=3080561 RepID=UPI0029533226|nr:hypothetical protein [Terasakiella sp. A23]MDV7337999.1 hypothetical protein [Terasakiella sp. A23]